MVNKSFEAYKIKRELKKNGVLYEFFRKDRNEFGEGSGEIKKVGKIKGLYHEQNSYISMSSGETTQFRTEKIPMILALFDDSLFVETEDFIFVNGKKYKVTGTTNVQDWDIALDISLRVVDDGR